MNDVPADPSLLSTSTIILIPAFNEADVIAEVIEEIKSVCDFAVVVIDDCSTDDTAVVSQDAGATVISLAAQLGAWGATQTGMRYALRHGYEIAITMDADGQHEAQSLAMLMQPVVDGVADVAIGACTERGTALRQVAWVLMKRASGLRLEDITSGFRVYNLVALGILVQWRATLLDYQDIGVLLLMQSHGLRIVDIKINMRQRRNGKSRVFYSWATVGYYMCQTLLLGLTKRSRAQKYQPRTLNE